MSVIAKLLEMLVLSRRSVLLSEAGIPHVNQSAYRKGVSCSDAIFAILKRQLQGMLVVYYVSV